MPNVNHHKQIIEEIRYDLDTLHFTAEPYLPYSVVELHTTSMRRMPANLKGVPDLIITNWAGTTYCEIKPLYKKSRRDTLNDAQCMFAVDFFDMRSDVSRYWIVKDAAEFRMLWDNETVWHVEEFHRKRLERWCNARGVEIPWQ